MTADKNTPNPEGGDSLLIRVYRPEGYEDVADEILLSDLGIHPDFRAELEAGRFCGVGEDETIACEVAVAPATTFGIGVKLSSVIAGIRLRKGEGLFTFTAKAREKIEHQPRDAGQRDDATAMHWIDRYAAGIDDECQLDRIAEALATRALSESAGGPSLEHWERESMRYLAYGLRNMSAVGFSRSTCDDAASWLEKLSTAPARAPGGDFVSIPRDPIAALPILHALADAAGMERLPDPGNPDDAYPITGSQSTVWQWYQAVIAAAGGGSDHGN